MASLVPDELIDERDIALWQTLDAAYDDYCGSDEGIYPERTQGFLAVLDVVRRKLTEQ